MQWDTRDVDSLRTLRELTMRGLESNRAMSRFDAEWVRATRHAQRAYNLWCCIRHDCPYIEHYRRRFPEAFELLAASEQG